MFWFDFDFRKDPGGENDLKSGPTSIHVSEICDEDLNKNKQTDETYPIEVVEALRAEIYELKEWKSRQGYTNHRTFFSEHEDSGSVGIGSMHSLVPRNPSIIEQWVPEAINFGKKHI